MNVTQAFRMAVKSLLGKKGRAVLTMLGIIIGVAAVIIMVSIQQAQTDYWMDYIKKMGTNRIEVNCSVWGQDISKDIYRYCQSMTELVEGVTPNQQTWDAKVKYGSKSMQNGRVFFGSDQYSVCTNNTIVLGRDLGYMDIEHANRVCVIGAGVKNKFFEYKNPIGETLTIKNERFTIVGVYAQKFDGTEYSEDAIVVVPYTLNRLLMKTGQVDAFVVKARDTSTTKKAVDRLNVFLATKTRYLPYSWFNVYSMNESIQQGDDMQKQNMLFFGGIAAISLLVGGIGIMNIMLVTVKERTREIGIRKAIGAERRSIILQFLIESSMLSAVGGLIGVVLGILGTMVWIKLSADKVVLPTMFIMLLAFGVSVALGIVFGLYPAAKASRLQPVEALRGE